MSDVRYMEKEFVGRTVVWVGEEVVTPGKSAERTPILYLDTGKAWRFDLFGDCCSVSEYTPEGLAAFQELLGAEIRGVEDRCAEIRMDQSAGREDLTARETKLIEKYPPEDHDSWHFLVFITDRGHVTIDWRNMSNGYYDGNVSIFEAEPLPPPLHDAALEQQYDYVRKHLPLLRAALAK